MRTEADLSEKQVACVRFLEDKSSAVVWGDVGEGKTVVLLTHILRSMERFDAHRVLVVGTRLIAERAWNTEVREWEHLAGLRVRRIVGTPAHRLAALNADADIWVVSRDNLCGLEEQFIRIEGTDAKGKPIRVQYRKFKWDALIFDESQSFKSPSASRTKSARRLRQLVSKCYLATGSF